MIEHEKEYFAEVIVCGGGTAGAFAAVAAAQAGADVLLVEALGGLGGSPVYGLVTPMMTVRIDGEPQCSYLSLKLQEKLSELDGLERNGRGTGFDPLLLGITLEQMCVEAGARMLLNTMVCGVEMDNGRIRAVRGTCLGVNIRICGEVFVDCTGDGVLSALAGADWEQGNPVEGKNQPMSLRYLAGGVDLERLGLFFDSFGDWKTARGGKQNESQIYAAVTDRGNFALTPLFLRAIREGNLTEKDRAYWQLFGVPGRRDTIALNNPEFFEYTDAMDPVQRTAVLLEGKRAIVRQLHFYRKYFPGCENAYLSAIAAMPGIRESRRVLTQYRMTGEDLLMHRKFEDCISQANYPVDIHGLDADQAGAALPQNMEEPWYEIPYRCLEVKNILNLLVAGRCTGADFVAQSAIRIQSCCRSMGEAAGIGAAMAAARGVETAGIDGKEVRQEMIRKGAVFAGRQ